MLARIDAEVGPVPVPANRRRPWPWIGGLLAAAAALLVGYVALPSGPVPGDPSDWIARGEESIGPAVDLRLAVRSPTGEVARFRRDASYTAGDTLLFRYDAHVPGHLHLVRIDADGVVVIHQQAVGGTGTADLSGDLETGGGLVGYSMETGEAEAVFALIRTENPLAPDRLVRGLAVEPATDAVCAAARALGGRCAAERVEAVR